MMNEIYAAVDAMDRNPNATAADMRALLASIEDTADNTSARNSLMVMIDMQDDLEAHLAAQAPTKAEKVVKIKLTTAQADRLEDLLPESLCGLRVTATRAYGTRQQFADALALLGDDDAIELMLTNLMVDDWHMREFAERQTLKSMKMLREKIRRVI